MYAPGGSLVSLGWELKGWCDGTITPTSSPLQLSGACEDDPWSSINLAFYKEGTRVRKSDRIYECRNWPWSLKCRDRYYEPEKSKHWNDAWIYIGICETINGAVATIEGLLSISTESRRSLLIVEGLDKSESADLIFSAQATIEGIACSNLPADYACTVEISSVNNQAMLTRRLRFQSDRKLAGMLVFGWVAQITFSVQNDSDVQEIADLVSSTISNDLNKALADDSLLSSLTSKSSSEAVRNINFGTASIEMTKSPKVKLQVFSPKKEEFSNRCSKLHVTMNSVSFIVCMSYQLTYASLASNL